MKFIISLIAFINLTAQASLKVIDSEIKFSATGKPSFIKANGDIPLKEAKLDIENETLNGTAVVELTQLNSGIKLRDEHLKDKYLHTKKYPQAVLKFDNQKINLSGKAIMTKATLMLHGVSKQIEIKTILERENDLIVMSNEFEFLLTDYSIELPSFQGITAADKVKLKVRTELKK